MYDPGFTTSSGSPSDVHGMDPNELEPVNSNMTELDQHFSHDVDDDEHTVTPDLFVCITECYIYETPGHDDGHPLDHSHIIYDTKPDEIIQLDVDPATGDYKIAKEKYVRCLNPKEGWVYLPEGPTVEYDWGILDAKFEKKKRAKMQLEEQRSLTTDAEEEEDDGDAVIGKLSTDYAQDGNMEAHLDTNDNPFNMGDDSDNMGVDDDDEKDDPFQMETTLRTDARREYTKQRMMAQTQQPELEHKIGKIMQIQKIQDLVFYFRRHPFLPGLIILIIQAVIEGIILWDVIADMMVADDIIGAVETHPEEARLARGLYTLSCSFIVAPYVIAWTSLAAFNMKKLRQNRNHPGWITFVLLFSVCPFGILFLLLNDIYHFTECVIKPIFWLLTLGKELRTISYDELGYYKLRRVSEIFSEAIPQALLQGVMLVTPLSETLDLNILLVCFGLITSALVLLLWTAIIYFEGKKNGMKFAEYTTVIMQGSFDFVEMLPAIERGTATGRRINWTKYKFSTDGVGHVSKALNSPSCKLEFLKISTYTILALDRAQCRFLGSALSQSQRRIELKLGRLDSEIMGLFDKYDVDKGKSLDFEEFMHLSLDLKMKVNERLFRSDALVTFEELADKINHEIWMLDLQIKIKGSLKYEPLLDYELPLTHALDTKDLELMTLLMAYKYDEFSEENELEFESCVKKAITDGDVKSALCLCEHKGVPVVVHMERGSNLVACDDDGFSDPYVTVSIFDEQQKTQHIKQSLDPQWDEDLLFIIPFEKMAKYNNFESVSETKLKTEMTQESFAYGKGGTQLMFGQSFAAIDVSGSVIHGLNLPKYCKDAIVQENQRRYGHGFRFQTAMTADQLQEATPEAPDLDRRQTSMAYDKLSNRSGSLHEFLGSSNSKEVLKVQFQVFDHDMDEEDDFMGSYKVMLSTADNNSRLHQQLIEKRLVDKQKMGQDMGQISFRLYMNAFDKWQEWGMRYIDKDRKDTRMQTDRDLMKIEIKDGGHKEMADAFRM